MTANGPRPSGVSVTQPCGCTGMFYGVPEPDCSVCQGTGKVTFRAREGEPCVRCSECEGDHHWIDESCFEDEDGKVLAEPFCGYVCKHCGARSEMCDACENPVYPSPPGSACCPECTS